MKGFIRTLFILFLLTQIHGQIVVSFSAAASPISAVDDSTLEQVGGGSSAYIRVKDAGIISSKIANHEVTRSKIYPAAVGRDQIEDGEIITALNGKDIFILKNQANMVSEQFLMMDHRYG